MNTEYICKLIQRAAELENHNDREDSKPVNFFLTYDSDNGAVLDPMIEQIIREIEASERTIPPSDGGRYPRKKKRSRDTHRRFKQAVRILILNMLQAYKLLQGRGRMLLGVSKDEGKYRGRYAPPDMTYDPLVEAFDGLVRLGYMDVVHQGFRDYTTGTGWTTRVQAGDKLISSYRKFKAEAKINFLTRRIKDRDGDELIILRDKDENGKRKVAYKDGPFTNGARRNLKAINRVIAAHEIDLVCTDEEYNLLLKN